MHNIELLFKKLFYTHLFVLEMDIGIYKNQCLIFYKCFHTASEPIAKTRNQLMLSLQKKHGGLEQKKKKKKGVNFSITKSQKV